MKITIDFGSGEPLTLDLARCLTQLSQTIDKLTKADPRDLYKVKPEEPKPQNGAPAKAAEAAADEPAPPAPEPKKPEPTPAPVVEEPVVSIESEITEEEVKQLILQYTVDHSPKEAVSILQRVAGVGKVNRIPADKLEAVYAEFNRLMEKSLGV